MVGLRKLLQIGNNSLVKKKNNDRDERFKLEPGIWLLLCAACLVLRPQVY